MGGGSVGGWLKVFRPVQVVKSFFFLLLMALGLGVSLQAVGEGGGIRLPLLMSLPPSLSSSQLVGGGSSSGGTEVSSPGGSSMGSGGNPSNPSIPSISGIGGYSSLPGGGHPILIPVMTSFPEEACSLVDNRPHLSLLKAVQNLSVSMQPVAECTNEGKLAQLSYQKTEMEKAAQLLMSFWDQPESLSPERLPDYDGSLKSILRGIENIGRLTTSNSLLNGRCGERWDLGSGSLIGKHLLLGLSDLVVSLSPYLLMAVTINPSLSVYVPFMLGGTVFASLPKIYYDLTAQNSVDISQPMIRQAILVNVCEFMKISKRIRHLLLSQNGQVEAILKELEEVQSRSLHVMRGLEGQASQNLTLCLHIRKEVLSQLDSVQTFFHQNIAFVSNSVHQFGESKNPHLVCKLGQEISNTLSSPLRAQFEVLNSLMEVPSLSQKVMLQTEEELYKEIHRSDLPVEVCAEKSRFYLSLLSEIFSGSSGLLAIVGHLRAALQQVLVQKSPEYAHYSEQESKMTREVRELKSTLYLLQQINATNSVLDKAEIHIQMSQLRRAFFNGSLTARSPVQAWLDFLWDYENSSQKQFQEEMASLIADSFHLTSTSQRLSPPLLTFSGIGSFHPSSEYFKKWEEDVVISEHLANLKQKDLPLDAPQRPLVCQNLENAWLAWLAAFDYLGAIEFFCKAIEPYLDGTVDRKILRLCLDRKDLLGQVQTPSLLAVKWKQIGGSEALGQAAILSQKIQELHCLEK